MATHEQGIIDPEIEYRNKQNKRILAIKRKKYGYFIFEFHPEQADLDIQDKIHEAFAMMKDAAYILGIPLYDIFEMQKKVDEQLGKMNREDLPEYEKQVDITVELMDHSSGRTDKLVLGISTLQKDRVDEVFKAKDEEMKKQVEEAEKHWNEMQGKVIEAEKEFVQKVKKEYKLAGTFTSPLGTHYAFYSNPVLDKPIKGAIIHSDDDELVGLVTDKGLMMNPRDVKRLMDKITGGR